MPDKPWKQFEREVAKFFGCRRQRCSGSSGIPGETRSDTTHDSLFIEAKYSKRHPIRTMFDQGASASKKSGRVAVLRIPMSGIATDDLVVSHSGDCRYVFDSSMRDRVDEIEIVRKTLFVARLYRETEALSIRERKTPVVALKDKGRRGFLIAHSVRNIPFVGFEIQEEFMKP